MFTPGGTVKLSTILQKVFMVSLISIFAGFLIDQTWQRSTILSYLQSLEASDIASIKLSPLGAKNPKTLRSPEAIAGLLSHVAEFDQRLLAGTRPRGDSFLIIIRDNDNRVTHLNARFHRNRRPPRASVIVFEQGGKYTTSLGDFASPTLHTWVDKHVGRDQ